MMSEKTENRLATFVAILIAIFMAVGLNAQPDPDYFEGDVAVYNRVLNLTGNDLANLPKKAVFLQNVYVEGNTSQNMSGMCLRFMKKFIQSGGATVTINDSSIFFKKPKVNKNGVKLVVFKYTIGNLNGTQGVKFNQKNVLPDCMQAALPVEAVDFYYQDKGNGTGSFKLMVTDEYDIEQYKIELTDQDGIDIGYKWFYASETEDGLYRVYEIPVTLPTDCADIDIIYAKIFKMEKSTMEYEQILRTISILNQ